jgi:hypothetical protein
MCHSRYRKQRYYQSCDRSYSSEDCCLSYQDNNQFCSYPTTQNFYPGFTNNYQNLYYGNQGYYGSYGSHLNIIPSNTVIPLIDRNNTIDQGQTNVVENKEIPQITIPSSHSMTVFDNGIVDHSTNEDSTIESSVLSTEDRHNITPRKHNECKICYQGQIDTVITLCGHAMCHMCSDKIDKCPLCSKSYNKTHILKIYL